MPLVSIILPTYNEVENIVPLVEAIDRAVTEPHEMIVVDDHSPDGTSRVIQEVITSGRLPCLRLETRMTDRGLTKSIWRGIELAKGDVVVWLDCDFSMPPEKIPELLAKIREGFDIAVGSRFVPGGSYKTGSDEHNTEDSVLAVLLSRILNAVLRYALFPRFRDYTSGFIAIRREVFRSIRLTGDYGEYFMDLMVRAMLLRYTFVEIPYINAFRRAGESKTAPDFATLVKRGIKYLWTLVWLEWIRLKYAMGFSIEDLHALPLQ